MGIRDNVLLSSVHVHQMKSRLLWSSIVAQIAKFYKPPAAHFHSISTFISLENVSLT